MSDPLIARCERHLGPTLEFLRAMVGINSFTENAAGVNRLSAVIAEAFAPLGFAATTHATPHPAYGRHLVLRGAAAPGAPTLALVSHLDTVFTEDEEARNDFHWRPAGTRIHGPGTNDIKGGTALIHLMLSVMAEEQPDLFGNVNWIILLNACEEVISDDFRRLCREQLPEDARACLIFEADGGDEAKDFSFVLARKGRATFSVEVEGRGAHAGSSHQRGANAVVQLAEVVTKLSRITNYDDKITVNVGSISGGTVTNRIPHFARAELEMRAFDAAIYARAKAAILACAGPGSVQSADGHQCQVTVKLLDETKPWPRNPGTDQLFALWQKAGVELGLLVKNEERGGLSDGNVLCDLFPTLDGLGPRGEASHCSEQSADGSKQQEWVDVTSFAPKAALNLRAIATLLKL